MDLSSDSHLHAIDPLVERDPLFQAMHFVFGQHCDRREPEQDSTDLHEENHAGPESTPDNQRFDRSDERVKGKFSELRWTTCRR